MIKFGMKTMNMTQGEHYGAYDFAGATTSVEPWYAYDTAFKVVAVYGVTGRVFHSVNKIKYRNGQMRYVSILMWHSEHENTKVGDIIPAGGKMYQEGNYGHSTGNHVHAQFAYDLVYPVWNTRGGQNYWEFPYGTAINPNQIYYLGDTKLVNSQNIDFERDDNDVEPVEYSEMVEDFTRTMRHRPENVQYKMRFKRVAGAYSDERMTIKNGADYQPGMEVISKFHKIIDRNGKRWWVHVIDPDEKGVVTYFAYKYILI